MYAYIAHDHSPSNPAGIIRGHGITKSILSAIHLTAVYGYTGDVGATLPWSILYHCLGAKRTVNKWTGLKDRLQIRGSVMEFAFGWGWDVRVENWMHSQLSTVYTVEKYYIKKTKRTNFFNLHSSALIYCEAGHVWCTCVCSDTLMDYIGLLALLAVIFWNYIVSNFQNKISIVYSFR